MRSCALGLEHVDRRLPARAPGAFAGRLEELPMELLGPVEQGASLSPHQISGITRHTSLNELPKVDLSRPAHRLKTTRSNGPEKSREAQKVVKGRYILGRDKAPARAVPLAKAARATVLHWHYGGGQSDQAAVLDFMASPEAYGSVERPVDRIETHASVVFLAGTHAYKIKRAVKYPFLDFSTLGEKASRAPQRACHQSPHRASALSRSHSDNRRRKREISSSEARASLKNGHSSCAGSIRRSSTTAWRRRGACRSGCHAAACAGDRRLSSRGESLPRAGDERRGVARGAQGQRGGTCRREGRLSRRCARHRQSWKPRCARGACPPASGARQRRLCAPLPRRSASPQHRRDRRRAGVVRRHRVR